MTKDMTEGSPFKLILAFMFPVFCGNIFQNFYNLVDTMIVGQFLGVDALAAVGSTGSMNFFVVGWIIGMTSGFGVLISQAYGARDEKKVKHYTAMSAFLCVILAICMTIGLLFANDYILKMMNTPDKIFTDTHTYIAIIYAGLPVTILYNMLTAISRALGDSKTPLYFLLLSSILNIVLDVVLVTVIPLGVAGAAYATVFSQGVSAVLCLYFVWKKFSVIHFGKAEAKISGRSIWKLLKISVPMGLQFSITALGAMIVQSSLNMLGSTYIAAYSATSKVQNAIMQLFTAIGTTIATYVGQNYGAGKIERIRQGVNCTIKIEAVYSIFVMALGYFVLPMAVKLFVEDPTGELQAIARQMFHVSIWFYFPLGLIFIYRNALQGLGNGLVPMMGGIFELLARGGTIWLLFDKLQFMAICLSDPFAWVSALIPLIPYYYWYMNQIKRSRKEKIDAFTVCS